MRIALTGGIACGKSLLSRYLNEMGVETFDADDAVHQLEAPGGKCAPAVLARFGTLDRSELARLCFDSAGRTLDVRELERNRRDLEAILLPEVRQAIADWCDAASDGVLRVAVIPLLFEVHWDRDFDIILCVTSSPQSQLRRMMENRGMSREAAVSRINSQMTVAEKSALSDYSIPNDGDESQLRDEARKAIEYLIERTKK